MRCSEAFFLIKLAFFLLKSKRFFKIIFRYISKQILLASLAIDLAVPVE